MHKVLIGGKVCGSSIILWSLLYLLGWQSNRLTTGDRMLLWSSGANPTYVFCNQLETRDHLFFSWPFSADVWSQLTRDLLRGRFTHVCTELMNFHQSYQSGFTHHVPLQICSSTLGIHSIWCERNDRRHRELLQPQFLSWSACWTDKFETDV